MNESDELGMHCDLQLVIEQKLLRSRFSKELFGGKEKEKYISMSFARCHSRISAGAPLEFGRIYLQ